MTNAERPEPRIDEQNGEPAAGDEQEYVSFADQQEQQNNEPEGEEAAEAAIPGDESGKIQALEFELARAKETLLRALADAENTRKRAIRDREDAGKYAIASFAKDILSFADNFKRALESFPEEVKSIDGRIESVVTGIEAMEKELAHTLEKHGIRKIEPLDETFDPNFHEVMFETPVADKQGGTIIQVIEPGYIIKDRLLRPARVGVAKADDSAPQGNGKPGGVIDEQV